MILFRRQSLAVIAIALFSVLCLAQSPETSVQAPAQRTAEQREAYRKAMEEADQKIAGR